MAKSKSTGGIKKTSYKASLGNFTNYATTYEKALSRLTEDLKALWRDNEDQNPLWNGSKAAKWAKKAVKNQNNHVKCLKSIKANIEAMNIVYNYHKGA